MIASGLGLYYGSTPDGVDATYGSTPDGVDAVRLLSRL